MVGLVNGDTSPAIFEPSNGGVQPVVAIDPAVAEDGYVAGAPALLTFGQSPSAANYNHCTLMATTCLLLGVTSRLRQLIHR